MITSIPRVYSTRNFHQEKSFRDHGISWRRGDLEDGDAGDGGGETLPEPMREAVTSFFDANEGWLERSSRKAGATAPCASPGTPSDTARVVIACLEGAMLVARPYGDPDRFQTMATSLLASLTRE